MGTLLPGISSTTFSDRLIHIDETDFVSGPDCLLKSSVTDSGASPTTTIRKGCVIGKKNSDSKFYLADSADVTRDAPPSITGAGRSNGNGVVKLVGNHGTISVTTATGTGTLAENVTDLNADKAFAAHYVASDSGGQLKIEARNPGKGEWFYIHTDTMASAGFAEGEANAVAGTDGEYYVTEEEVSMLDPQTNAVADRPVRTSHRAFYDESELLHTTPEALACLRRRGARFG